jgi:hypothetical protein
MVIRLNDQTKYPTGPPIPVHQFPADQVYGHQWLTSSDDLLVTSIGTSRRNIWIQDLPK